MSNKSQVYNINNQIDILKNNNINKLSLPATQFTAAKGANLKNLSIGEYKYFIESKKNKLEALNSNNSAFNLNLEKGFTGSGPNLGQGVTDCAGAPQIKIANIFNKYIKAFGGWYNNNVVRGALSALAQGQTASGLQTNRSYLNLVTPVSLKLGSANNINIKYENFQFKKATYNKFIYAMEKATNILILAFKSSGCLISKPIFTVVYNGSGYGPSINASDPRLEGWRSPALNSKGNFNNKFSGCGYGAGATASGSAEIMGGEQSTTACWAGGAQPANNKKAGGASTNFKVIIHLFYYIKKDTLVTKITNFNKSLNNFNTVEGGATALGSVGTETVAAEGGCSEAGGRASQKYFNIFSILNDKLLYLSDYLTKLFNSNIEIELVRLYKPYQDSNILVQQLNSDSYNKKFIRIISRLFKTINIYNNKSWKSTYQSRVKPSYAEMDQEDLSQDKNLQILGWRSPNISAGGGLCPTNNISFPSRISGLNIKLAGRTVKEKVIPRLTVKRAQRGTLNRLNAKLIEKSMFTDKTRKGAFNFTVRLSHIFK